MELPNKFTVPVILIYKGNEIVIKCYTYNYHEQINEDTLIPRNYVNYIKQPSIISVKEYTIYNKRRFYHKPYNITVSEPNFSHEKY